MRGYFGLGQLSATEKSDILDQHKSVYNGYQTMQPQVSNTQPLTVYDFAGDKEGLVVNNKGEVKKYTNMGINEQASKKSMCECGGTMYEGECMECGYKDGMSEEDDSDWDATLMDGLEEEKDSEMCECGGTMYEGMCNECGSGYMEEETGHLDDIYKVRDLNLKHGDFDYVEGGGNDVDTFEGMHKNLYKEDESDDFVNYDDNFEDPDNEDDGFEDLNSAEMDEDETDEKPYEKGKFGMKASRARASFEPTPKEKEILEKLFGQYGDDIPPIVIRYLRKLPRKVFTKRLKDLGLISKADMAEQGGNSDDMDVDNVEPAYDFESNGPMDGGDSYPVNEYETMESAFSDEIDEVDISGSQGIYSDMDPAFDFDSEGPGKAGPYQEFSYESEEDEDMDDEMEEIDEDLRENFKNQKNKIMEMFNRFNKYN